MAIKGTLVDMQLKLLHDGKFSDMTVVCKDRTWKCHRNILCQRCSFFEAACNGKFKEAKTMVVKLEEDDPEGVDVLLEYLYTLGKPNFNKTVGQSHLRAEYAFILGDKYGLTQLRDYGRLQLIEGINTEFSSWNGTSDAMKQKMFTQIEHVWSWQQEGSKLIQQVFLQNLSTMHTSMLDDERFTNLMWEQRQFNIDFVKYIFNARSIHRR